MDGSSTIAIDIGGTKVSGAIFDSSGALLKREISYLENKGSEQAGNLVVQMIDQLLADVSQSSANVLGVGVAVPGIYNAALGTVWAPNIPGWQEYPLHKHLSEAVKHEIPIIIESDRACYISGEVWQGAAQGSKDAIFLAVGTGIGAGILIDGRILRGSNDIAGAIGWMTLTDDFLPPYEDHGCFEHHASGGGISRLASEAYAAESGEALENISTSQVFKKYQQNDPIASKLIKEAVSHWGRAVANLVSLFNPEIIVFGGGVFGPATDLIDEIHQEAVKWAQPISIQQVRLAPSELGSDAGLYGAASLVRNRLESEDE